MRPDEYIALDGFSLAELVRQGEVTPRALVRVDLIDPAAPLGEDARLRAFAPWLEREQPWSGRLTDLGRRFL